MRDYKEYEAHLKRYEKLRYVADMLIVLITLVVGAGLGIAASVPAYAAIASRISNFSLDSAFKGFIAAGLIGAVSGGGFALFLLGRISKRR